MLKPLKNKIILEAIQKEKVTSSGIVLTRTDPHEVNRGKVIAIGSEVEFVEVGNEILPDWNKATLTKFDGTDYFIVSEDNVVLIFTDE